MDRPAQKMRRQEQDVEIEPEAEYRQGTLDQERAQETNGDC